MDAIQTFWTTPGIRAEEAHGGWLDPRFHWMSWALSASLLNEHFGKTILHTDLTGQVILAESLELPYTEIRITQEGLGDFYPKNWWVMRKMHTYSLADNPFVHVDGDAFLWNGMPEHLLQKPLIAQNSQNGFQCYRIAAELLEEAGVAMPAFMEQGADHYDAVNMGIVGGTDHALFKDFFSAIKAFYDLNLAGRTFPGQTTGFLNTLIEECFFHQYARSRGQSVATWVTDELPQGYGAIANSFDERFGLTHLIGTHKKDIYFCKQIEFQLKRRFPAAFRKVTRLVETFSGKSRGSFNFPQIDPFTESNVAASHIEPGLTMTFENADATCARFAESGHTDFTSIVRFEKAKHQSFLGLLQKSQYLDFEQQERLLIIENLLKQPIAERMDDLVCFDERIPLVRFIYPSKNTPYHLATIYDFGFEYKHIAHRPLDDLAVFMLILASDGISIASLTETLMAKSGKPMDEQARSALLHRIDLKMKELLFLGLLSYLPASESDIVIHANAASF